MKHFDNDMDELFNKAGQDYPLNTSKKDWDAVNAALHGEEAAVATTTRKNYFLRFLPLLLLLLIPVVFLMINKPQPFGKARSIEIEKKNDAVVQPQDENARTKLPGNTLETDDDKSATTIQNTVEPGINNNEVKPRAQAPGREDYDNMIDKKIITASTGINSARNTNLKNRPVKINETVTVNENNKTYSPVVGSTTVHMESQPKDVQLNSSLRGIDLSAMKPGFPYKDIDPKPAIKDYGEQSRSVPSKTNNKRRPSFYYGVKAGPDLSNIKGQRIEKAGYSAGVLVGFQFTPRLSLEIAGMWSSKKYYTDGKHFDKTRANMSPSLNIYYLDGGCNMIELPVAVRYLFSPTRNSFFVTAGLNTYLMNSENYEYWADAGTGLYEGYRTYKKSGNHLFSNLQLTGGYQFQVFNKTNIRLEPYLQLPLRQVGIGNMPITSAGVHVGLFRTIR